MSKIIKALQNIPIDDMKKLGICMKLGTIMKIMIVETNDHVIADNDSSNIIFIQYTLLNIVRNILNPPGCINSSGIIVKVFEDSIICFYNDHSKFYSVIQAVSDAEKIHNELLFNPIMKKMSICIGLSYGLVYRQIMYIQKKIFFEYYENILDNITKQKGISLFVNNICDANMFRFFLNKNKVYNLPIFINNELLNTKQEQKEIVQINNNIK